MCQGKEATIVDTDGGVTEGTEGDDVIYAERRASVLAKGGDDLVCLEDGYARVGPGRDSVQARGTDRREFVAVWDGEDVDIALAGGDDGVSLYFTSGGSGTIDAGSGTGALSVVTNSSVEVDLEDGLLAIDEDSASYRLEGFDHVLADSRRVELEGDENDNLLSVSWVSCAVSMEGGRGHDELKVMGNIQEVPEFDCAREPRPKLYGQRGNDRLLGRRYDDVLIGGAGRDTAEGSRGSDKCRAEREKGCER